MAPGARSRSRSRSRLRDERVTFVPVRFARAAKGGGGPAAAAPAAQPAAQPAGGEQGPAAGRAAAAREGCILRKLWGPKVCVNCKHV